MILEDIFDKGGMVVWVLAAYSVLALTIIAERVIRFALMRRPITSLQQELVDAMKNGGTEMVIEKMRGPEAALLVGLLQVL